MPRNGSGHGNKIGKKQELAIAALLTQPSHDAAAQAAGIGQATLTRWLKNESFQAAYREVRRRIVEHVVGLMQSAMGEAVMTLRAALTADRTADRIRAAQIIVEMGVKGLEVADVLDRVEELERFLSGQALASPTDEDGGSDS